MRMKRKVFAFILTGVLALLASACGNRNEETTTSENPIVSQTETQDTAPEPELVSEAQPEEEDPSGMDYLEWTPPKVDPIKKSMKKLESITSMEAQMVINANMSMTADGQEQAIESMVVMDMVCFSNPLRVKVNTTVDMGEQGSLNMQIYAEPSQGGAFNMYMFDGQNWFTQKAVESDLAEYDARSNLIAYIGDASLYKQEGTEQINDANAYKYSYVLTKDELREEILGSGVLDSFNELGLDVSQVDSLMDDLGDVTAYLWIDEASYYPVRYEMDLTTIMNNLMANVSTALGEQVQGLTVTFPEVKIVITCSNFNSATDFTVPEEAKH